MDDRAREVRRLLDRYLVEIVEHYDFCPWARGSRLAGDIGIDILWGTPTIDMWVAAAMPLLATARVVMLVAPELPIDRIEFHGVREQVSTPARHGGDRRVSSRGTTSISATPPRLVPYLRRSSSIRCSSSYHSRSSRACARGRRALSQRAAEAEALGGRQTESDRVDISAISIAEDNHGRVVRDAAAIAARFDDIAADRARSYARVGIAVSTFR